MWEMWKFPIPTRFQFLIGSLKTYGLFEDYPEELNVSIPHRQSKNKK